jgi:hypothetical protein
MKVLFLLVVMQGMYNPIKISDDLFYQNAFQCSRAAYQMNQQVLWPALHPKDRIWAYCVPKESNQN